MTHMKRVQIQFPDDLAREVEAEAASCGLSVAELVRQGMSRMLADSERRRRWDRALASIGGGHSGLRDLAENHDHYLNEGPRW